MKVLLHICCGVCAAGAAERLISEGHQVTGYFYNPNIHPEVEYLRRLDASRKAAQGLGFQLVEGPYTPDDWFAATDALKDEPEGGKRCDICFRYRLQQTFLYLPESGCDMFATTLTISPHKPAAVINRIGTETGGDKYFERDFKKKAGFQRAGILSRELDIYRQDYCGCLYSIRVD